VPRMVYQHEQMFGTKPMTNITSSIGNWKE